MAYLTSTLFFVIIAMTSSMPQLFPNQGIQQQPGNQFFPNQNFQGQGFPNQGFSGQGFPNQGFPGQPFPNQGFPGFPNQGFFQNQQQPNGQLPVNQNFQNQRFPNQGSQNNQFVPNPNNPFLQGTSNQGNPNTSNQSGTLDEFTQQNQNQQPFNQQPFNQQRPNQMQNQQQFLPFQPTQQTPATPATTPGAQPAQAPALLACARNCPTTSEYNPVCGTDQVAYPNIRRLDCANQCGQRLDPNWQAIQVFRQGACTSGQRVP